MKCSNCTQIILSTFHCRYCLQSFCSLVCLEIHTSKYHPIKNNSVQQDNIISPYLINGFFKNSITYDNFYSLKNFVPIYDEYGKLKIIGSGSYGQVYLALHTINKKYYAIKHMDKKKLFSLLHSLSSIQKEINIQSKIDHPNIVKLLFVKETNISYDLIMEYASTGSLFHYIRKYKGLSENKSFSLFIQVVNAINFLHQNDLIHRDIKPENILMYENNVVRLCDFGWCVKLDGHQRGTFCGTTEYMSPELVNHEGYGKEIDVWSLGVLLYEMIHGYSPFRPNKPKFNEKDVMENIKNHNLIFERKISEECKDLIYHLLDPNINLRYKVEDIYNSKFVKKYELMHFDYPDNNLVLHYNKNLNNNNTSLNINKNNENINVNNIIYSEIPQSIDNNVNKNINNSNSIANTYNNIQIQDNKNIYNFNYNDNSIKTRNLSSSSLNRGVYSQYISFVNNENYGILYNGNYANNYCINNNTNNNIDNINKNINVVKENNINHQRNIGRDNKLLSNKTADNFYPLNIEKNREKEIIDIYSEHNNEKIPQDNKRDNKQFINFNNNSFLYLAGQNQNINNNNLITKNINDINQINNIWNSSISNNTSQINTIINPQYTNIEQPQNNNKNINSEEIANKLISNITNSYNTKSLDNNVNYNYYYNFNNYNNNYTNNYFNNSYSSLANISNPLLKKVPSSSNNNNSIGSINLNINYNNSLINNNCIIEKNQTPSTIPTSSMKNIVESKNQIIKENSKTNNNINIINKVTKISEFEIGEENYNPSEKEQNEFDSSLIKINVIKDLQKINNRKYLSKSDYSIINKKHKDIKKPNINNHYSNSKNNSVNNSYRIANKEEVSDLKKNSIQKKISAIDLKNKTIITEIINQKKNTFSKNISNLKEEKDPKILDENKENIKIHEIKVANMSIPIPNNKKELISPHKKTDKNVNKKNQIKSKSYCGKNDNNIVVEIKTTNNKESINNNKEDIYNENKKKVIEKINKEKKDYIRVLKEKNINNKNQIIINKEIKEGNQNNFISDVLCSIFNSFDSKKDEKNEINILKKEIKNNKNMSSKLSPKKTDLNSKKGSFIKINNNQNYKKITISKETNKINNERNNKKLINFNNKGLTPNLNKSPFAKINLNNYSNNCHNSPKIVNLGHIHLENCNSASNVNRNVKLNNITKTQPNSYGLRNINFINVNNNNAFTDFKNELHNHQKILKPSTSSGEINKDEKVELNNNQITNDQLKEIPITIKEKNKLNKNDSSTDEYPNLSDSKIITPKKRYIFNRVNPIKLLGAFRKELTSFSNKEQIIKVKNNKK